MEEISKKDLLSETGISYGQLYRWKREGLIPEDWFIKRSAFTGQETFFPRDRMLERVQEILAQKDTHSLDEIREDLANKARVYQIRESLLSLSDMNEEFVDSLQAPATITELSWESFAAVVGLHEMTIRAKLKLAEAVSLIDDALYAVASSTQIPSTMTLAKAADSWHFIVASQATWLATDRGVSFVETLQVADVATRIRRLKDERTA
ncbi:MAG: YhbD family protein [Coriobacteriia bacterium]|nr:YhbD family protein [Coriobacteriia bacterium]